MLCQGRECWSDLARLISQDRLAAEQKKETFQHCQGSILVVLSLVHAWKEGGDTQWTRKKLQNRHREEQVRLFVCFDQKVAASLREKQQLIQQQHPALHADVRIHRYQRWAVGPPQSGDDVHGNCVWQPEPCNKHSSRTLCRLDGNQDVSRVILLHVWYRV